MYKYLHNIKFNYSIISVILTPAPPSLQVREFPLQTGGEKGLRETISSKNRLFSDSSMDPAQYSFREKQPFVSFYKGLAPHSVLKMLWWVWGFKCHSRSSETFRLADITRKAPRYLVTQDLYDASHYSLFPKSTFTDHRWTQGQDCHFIQDYYERKLCAVIHLL